MRDVPHSARNYCQGSINCSICQAWGMGGGAMNRARRRGWARARRKTQSIAMDGGANHRTRTDWKRPAVEGARTMGARWIAPGRTGEGARFLCPAASARSGPRRSLAPILPRATRWAETGARWIAMDGRAMDHDGRGRDESRPDERGEAAHRRHP